MKPTEFLRDTVDLVKSIETRYLELAQRLYRIKEEKLYLGTYETFQEFLTTANITFGHASKLMAVHKNYVIEHKVEPQKLAQVGATNLYEAIPFIGTDGVEMAVAKATTLSRSEIVEEKRQSKHGEHTHTAKDSKRFAVCECGKMFEVYENYHLS